ncbi:uncharacterized protein BDR25DRAFT_260022, partial [Lindgomyces ingoldianus]
MRSLKSASISEQELPISFKDAVGRKFSFPFRLCRTWQGMQALINQSFLHTEGLYEQVKNHYYDLISPHGEIILPTVWQIVIQP